LLIGFRVVLRETCGVEQDSAVLPSDVAMSVGDMAAADLVWVAFAWTSP
jgi:hypothetical protein